MNRGRIQAQGDGTEKSSSWAINGDFTKTMGLNKIDELEQQLSRAELSKRDNALKQAKHRIRTSPTYGISAVMKKSYYNDFRHREIRIDIEVNHGISFVGNLDE